MGRNSLHWTKILFLSNEELFLHFLWHLTGRAGAGTAAPSPPGCYSCGGRRRRRLARRRPRRGRTPACGRGCARCRPAAGPRSASATGWAGWRSGTRPPCCCSPASCAASSRGHGASSTSTAASRRPGVCRATSTPTSECPHAALQHCSTVSTPRVPARTYKTELLQHLDCVTAHCDKLLRAPDSWAVRGLVASVKQVTKYISLI